MIKDKIIITERLTLKPLSKNDVNDFYEIYSNSNITLNCGFYPIATFDEALKFIEILKDNGTFAVWNNYHNKLIGIVGYDLDENNNAMLSYLFNEKFWGFGYATEAVKALIKYILPYVNKIMADCFTDNQESANVLCKCGFDFLKQYNRIFKSLDNTEKQCYLFQYKKH